MALATGHVSAAGAALVTGQLPKAKAMYALGRMLETPEVVNLIGLSDSAKSASTPMLEALSVRVLGAVGSIAKSKTMESIGKAATIGGAVGAATVGGTMCFK